MKKLALLLCIFSVFNAYGQKVEYSISAGPDYSFFTMSHHSSSFSSSLTGIAIAPTYVNSFPKIESKGKFGFFIENEITLSVNSLLAFSTGFGFNVKNADLTYGTGSSADRYIYHLYGINIPFLIQFRILEQKLRFTGGLDIASIMQAKLELEGTSSFLYVKELFEPVCFNFRVGVEYNVYKQFSLGLNFERNLSLLDKSASIYASSEYSELKLNSISFNIGYRF